MTDIMNKIILCIVVTVIPKCMSVVTNAHKGECYWWSFAESFSVHQERVNNFQKVDQVQSRSFVECCTKCDVSQGCIGVAFRGRECNLLNGTATGNELTGSDPNTDYKVMLYDTTFRPQSHIVEINCVGSRCNLYGQCHYDCTCEGIVNRIVDCKYLLSIGYTSDGVYTINPDDTVPFEAYCDMTNGGWTVFQRRQDSSTDFYLGWADYVAGFGNLNGNLWAGLDHLHAMTSEYDTELHVYMDTFEGETAEARYSSFSVGDASSGYVLSVSGYSGTAGDSLIFHNGMKFSTFDNDQDATSFDNCANAYKGAWWYLACHDSNLNGLYLSGHHTSYADGINWNKFKGFQYSLQTTVMRLKRNP